MPQPILVSMIRYDRTARGFAIALATLAGYVDALGFMATGGFFVSFMSGNSTRLAVGLAGPVSAAGVAAALIAAFVGGVILGSTTGRFAKAQRGRAVLALVSALLLAAATVGAALDAPLAGASLLAMAMGAENAVFERDGEVSIGLTYMTGALVKFGQRVTGALFGEDPLGWAPYLLLWAGLVLGAVAGAAAYPLLSLHGLWIAAAAAGVLALVFPRMAS